MLRDRPRLILFHGALRVLPIRDLVMDRGSIVADNDVLPPRSRSLTLFVTPGRAAIEAWLYWPESNLLASRRSRMLASSNEAAGSIIARWLALHEQRRQDGLPAVSVLAGPAGPGISCLRLWALRHHRALALVEPDHLGLEVVVKAWIDRLVADSDLFDEATMWLARRLDCPHRELGRSLRAKSPVELAMFLDEALPSSSATGVETACRGVLCRANDGMLIGDGLAEGLDASLADYPRPWVRVLVALGNLILPRRQPVLALICREDADDPEWFARLSVVARLWTELAIAQHSLALALVVEPTAWKAYLEQAPESRAKALLRDSAVLPTGTPAEETRQRLAESRRNQAPGLGLDRSIARLIADGASSELVGLFESASRALEQFGSEPADPLQADRARSAAERFLFERLESLPETTSLFRLNTSLGFRFGSSRAVEVDLAAGSLNLVVEIDGYYHFQDRGSYRRDRRKDLELQQHGYLVVRVLAEDVVCRLEAVLDTILAAVMFCRQRAHGS